MEVEFKKPEFMRLTGSSENFCGKSSVNASEAVDYIRVFEPRRVAKRGRKRLKSPRT
jgi:hypothetical protein